LAQMYKLSGNEELYKRAEELAKTYPD